LPVDLQAKLLRALTGRRVRPIGAREEIAIDVRFLFATSRDLPAMADAGSFRRDLYYRLRVFEIRVPPLRERPEDVPILVDCFRQVAGGRAPAFDEGALRTLAEHPWPGNVRELQNLVARLEVTGADRSITEADVRAALDEGAPGRLFPPALLRSRSLEELQADLEREYLADLHARHQGDLAAMADVLRISTRALYDRFRKLGLRPRDLRGPATEREN
jgi:DNA-binding NtrC family response regulator